MIVEDLDATSDPAEALRKALLALIFLTDRDREPIDALFVDYLLVGFAPVAARFQHH